MSLWFIKMEDGGVSTRYIRTISGRSYEMPVHGNRKVYLDKMSTLTHRLRSFLHASRISTCLKAAQSLSAIMLLLFSSASKLLHPTVVQTPQVKSKFSSFTTHCNGHVISCCQRSRPAPLRLISARKSHSTPHTAGPIGACNTGVPASSGAAAWLPNVAI